MPKGLEKETKKRIKNVLMDDKFVLSADQKSLHYMYAFNGSYRCLMKDASFPLLFKISDLNSFKKTTTQELELHKKT